MSIIVDTCVWSEAYRKAVRPSSERIVRELEDIIRGGQALLLGVIRQEILSGINRQEHFVKLREQMRAFDDHPVTAEDHEFAAELFNRYRSHGIQGSNTDFLICAVAARSHHSIFTTDRDFELISRYVKIPLHRW